MHVWCYRGLHRRIPLIINLSLPQPPVFDAQCTPLQSQSFAAESVYLSLTLRRILSDDTLRYTASELSSAACEPKVAQQHYCHISAYLVRCSLLRDFFNARMWLKSRYAMTCKAFLLRRRLGSELGIVDIGALILLIHDNAALLHEPMIHRHLFRVVLLPKNYLVNFRISCSGAS